MLGFQLRQGERESGSLEEVEPEPLIERDREQLVLEMDLEGWKSHNQVLLRGFQRRGECFGGFVGHKAPSIPHSLLPLLPPQPPLLLNC